MASGSSARRSRIQSRARLTFGSPRLMGYPCSALRWGGWSCPFPFRSRSFGSASRLGRIRSAGEKSWPFVVESGHGRHRHPGRLAREHPVPGVLDDEAPRRVGREAAGRHEEAVRSRLAARHLVPGDHRVERAVQLDRSEDGVDDGPGGRRHEAQPKYPVSRRRRGISGTPGRGRPSASDERDQVLALPAHELGGRTRRGRRGSGGPGTSRDRWCPRTPRLSRSVNDAARSPSTNCVARRWSGSESMRTPSMSNRIASIVLIEPAASGRSSGNRAGSGTTAPSQRPATGPLKCAYFTLGVEAAQAFRPP